MESDIAYMDFMKQYYEKHKLPVHKDKLQNIDVSVSSHSSQAGDSSTLRENEEVNISTCVISDPHTMSTHGDAYNTHCSDIVKHEALDSVSLQENRIDMSVSSQNDIAYMAFMKQYYEKHKLPVHKDSLQNIDTCESASSHSSQTGDSSTLRENEEVNRSIISDPHRIVNTHGNSDNVYYNDIVKYEALDSVLLQENGMTVDHASISETESVSIKAEQNFCVSNDGTVKIEQENDEFTSLLPSMTGISFCEEEEEVKSEEGDWNNTSLSEHIDKYGSNESGNANIIEAVMIKQESPDCDFIENRVVEIPLFEDLHLERDTETNTIKHTDDSAIANEIVCAPTQNNEESIQTLEMVEIKEEIEDDCFSTVNLEHERSDSDSSQCTDQYDADSQSDDTIKDELGMCSDLCQGKTTESINNPSPDKISEESKKHRSGKKSKLKHHLNGGVEFTCTECDSIYLSKMGLMKHMRRNHGGNGSHKCGDCFKVLASKYDLERHARSCTKRHCKSRRDAFDNHSKCETGICIDGNESRNVYNCIVCGKVLATMHCLNEHMRRHTGESLYRCAECGKTFTTKSACDVHQRVHTGARPFHCPKCPRSFRYAPDLKSHTLSPCKPFVCFICKNCSIEFTNQEKYEKHMLLMHSKKARHRPYECTQCEKSFLTTNHLQRHQLVHTQNRRYECFVCETPFNYSHHLRRHMLSHHKESYGVSKYSCDLCGKGFDDLEDMNGHQSDIHDCKQAESSMYNCKDCGMSFGTKTGLGVHMYSKHRRNIENKDKYTSVNLKELLLKTDTPNDDTLCPVCNVHFAHTSSRNKHFKQKHVRKASNGELVLKTDPLDLCRNNTLCPICNKEFSSRIKRNNHFRQQHVKQYSSVADSRRKSSKLVALKKGKAMRYV